MKPIDQVKLQKKIDKTKDDMKFTKEHVDRLKTKDETWGLSIIEENEYLLYQFADAILADLDFAYEVIQNLSKEQ